MNISLGSRESLIVTTQSIIKIWLYGFILLNFFEKMILIHIIIELGVRVIIMIIIMVIRI